MVLNKSKSIMLGDSAASKVYLGDNVIWEGENSEQLLITVLMFQPLFISSNYLNRYTELP